MKEGFSSNQELIEYHSAQEMEPNILIGLVASSPRSTTMPPSSS